MKLGPFQETFEPALRALAPLDFIFIDGHHDEAATVQYFRQALPFMRERAVLVFDDIFWSPGMKRAWETIRLDPAVSASVTLSDQGVCVKGSGRKRHYRLTLG